MEALSVCLSACLSVLLWFSLHNTKSFNTSSHDSCHRCSCDEFEICKSRGLVHRQALAWCLCGRLEQQWIWESVKVALVKWISHRELLTSLYPATSVECLFPMSLMPHSTAVLLCLILLSQSVPSSSLSSSTSTVSVMQLGTSWMNMQPTTWPCSHYLLFLCVHAST